MNKPFPFVLSMIALTIGVSELAIQISLPEVRSTPLIFSSVICTLLGIFSAFLVGRKAQEDQNA